MKHNVELGDTVLIAVGNTIVCGVVFGRETFLKDGDEHDRFSVQYWDAHGGEIICYPEPGAMITVGPYNYSARADFVLKWTDHEKAKEYVKKLKTPKTEIPEFHPLFSEQSDPDQSSLDDSAPI